MSAFTLRARGNGYVQPPRVSRDLSTATACEWVCTNDEYHADRSHISHSALDVFIQSPERYHAIYIAGTMQRRPATQEMLLGSAVHVRLLEPHRWYELVVVAPDVDRRTKAGKTTWEEFQLEAAGKTIITAEQAETVAAIESAVLRCDPARELLELPGRSEVSIRWEDDATGLPLKARIDRLADDGRIIDLKTAADPTPAGWSRSAANYGYHRQFAHYGAGRAAVHATDGPFVFIAIGTSPPYEVGVYELDDDAHELGRRQNAAALARLCRCLETDDWRSDWSKQVYRLALPNWVYSEQLST